jgi:hypothetical protein
VFLLLPWAQEVPSSNLGAPTIFERCTFSLLSASVRWMTGFTWPRGSKRTSNSAERKKSSSLKRPSRVASYSYRYRSNFQRSGAILRPKNLFQAPLSPKIWPFADTRLICDQLYPILLDATNLQQHKLLRFVSCLGWLCFAHRDSRKTKGISGPGHVLSISQVQVVV